MRKSLICLLAALVLILSSCEQSFTDAESYGKKLQDSGYSVYIITDDYTSAPSSLTTVAFIFELEMLKVDGALTPEKMLLAGNAEGTEVITVFYFDSDSTAEKAAAALQTKPYESSAAESVDESAMPSDTPEYTLCQSGNAVKVVVSLS